MKENILITGADGFVGGHLIDQLLSTKEVAITGTTFLVPDKYPHLQEKGVDLKQVDLRDEKAVQKLLLELKPSSIYHLAAQSFIPESFRDPWGTLENNIRMQLNLLEWMKNLKLEGRILIVGSSDIYGPVAPHEVPINEQQPFRPANPYSVSKVAQDMLGLQYFLSYGIQTIRVRPFNQIGPGQNKRFVAPAFASQIAEIEAGKKEPVVQVGSLNAQRDFTDVRDMVRAYTLIIEKGKPGDVYNIGSGEAHSIQELLDILLAFSTETIRVEIDPDRVRPVEVPVITCDAEKMKAETDWKRDYSFENSLLDVLNEWRRKPVQ